MATKQPEIIQVELGEIIVDKRLQPREEANGQAVASVREELEASSEIPKIETHTITRNGKTYEQKATRSGRTKSPNESTADVEPEDDDSETEEASTLNSDPTKPKKTPSKPPKQFDRSFWFKRWEGSIGPLVRLVDKIADGVRETNGRHHKAVHSFLNDATEEMMKWMRK